MLAYIINVIRVWNRIKIDEMINKNLWFYIFLITKSNPKNATKNVYAFAEDFYLQCCHFLCIQSMSCDLKIQKNVVTAVRHNNQNSNDTGNVYIDFIAHNGWTEFEKLLTGR